MIKDSNSPHSARDVTRRNNRGKRGLIFYSEKNGCVDIRVESGLEMNVGLLLESDPRVLSFQAQPFMLELASNTILSEKSEYEPKVGVKPRFYTPDFLCRMHDGTQLVIEAKHRSFQRKFDERQAEIESCLGQHGMNFLIVPDDAVNSVVIENVSSIHALRAAYQRMFVSSASNEISHHLSIDAEWEVAALSELLSGGKSAVLAGLLTGVLTTDLRETLFSETAIITPGYGELTHFMILELG